MRRLARLSTLGALAALSACAAPDVAAPGRRAGENEAAGECRAQAISDTTALLGPVAESTRDRLFQRCMAARGF